MHLSNALIEIKEKQGKLDAAGNAASITKAIWLL